MSNGNGNDPINKRPTFYPSSRQLDNDPGCPPNIGLPPEWLENSPLANAQVFAALSNIIPPGSMWFDWGGEYFADIAGGQLYHTYLTNLTIPAGYVAVVLHFGIGDSVRWSGDLFINGAPHPILRDFSSVRSTYDEVNPPGASTTSQRVYAVATFYDGATPGIGAVLDLRQSPVIIDENMNVRVRLRAHQAGAATRTTLSCWGYYAIKPPGVKIV
jgi:hypothetical protein